MSHAGASARIPVNAGDLAVVVAVTLAGLMRGITGFGGAMLMAPPLSVLLGPVPAVLTALTLESAAALVVFREAWPRINKRVLLYLIVPACFTVPLGGYLLVTLDAAIARKLIAAVIVVFSITLLFGFRYAGSPRPTTSIMLGSVVGVLLGSTSVGAPPVILYLLSGPDPQAVTRANLTVFVTTISVIGLIMLLAAGAVTIEVLVFAGVLCIPFLLATWLGGRISNRMSDLGVRRVALTLMLVMGVAGLLI